MLAAKSLRYINILYSMAWGMPYGMKILHGIKFYGFTVGDTTVKLKSVNFYFINNMMSLLKI